MNEVSAHRCEVQWLGENFVLKGNYGEKKVDEDVGFPSFFGTL